MNNRKFVLFILANYAFFLLLLINHEFRLLPAIETCYCECETLPDTLDPLTILQIEMLHQADQDLLQLAKRQDHAIRELTRLLQVHFEDPHISVSPIWEIPGSEPIPIPYFGADDEAWEFAPRYGWPVDSMDIDAVPILDRDGLIIWQVPQDSSDVDRQ